MPTEYDRDAGYVRRSSRITATSPDEGPIASLSIGRHPVYQGHVGSSEESGAPDTTDV